MQSKTRFLDLSGSDLRSDASIRLLASAVSVNPAISGLKLEDCSISLSGVTALQRMLSRNTTLQELDLSNNAFGDEGLAKLAQTLLTNRTLRVLRLDHNNLSDAALFELACAMRRNGALAELYLGSNSFRLDQSLFFDADLNTDVTAAEALAHTLRKNTSLSILDMSWNFNALTQAIEPLTDAMKVCPTLRRFNIAGTHLSDDCMLCLAEMVAASATVARTIDMRDCGVEARRTLLACTFRAYEHNSTLLGVDYGNLPLVQELTAQLRLLEKLLSRPTIATFPNDRVTQYVLLDGRFVQLHWDSAGVFVRGRLLYANGDSLAFDTVRLQMASMSSRLGACCCSSRGARQREHQRSAHGAHGGGSSQFKSSAHAKSTSALDSAVALAGNYVMVNGEGFNFDKVMAVVAAALNVADFFMDVAVLFTLAAEASSGSFYLSLAVLVFATLAQTFALLQDGRTWSALLQLASLSILLDAFNFVVLGRADGVQLPLRTSQPMQGLAAIYRLKLTEAMMESVPQVLLQSYLAIAAVRSGDLLRTVALLGVSITVAVLSIVTSLVQSDIAIMTSWRKSAQRKIVTVPTLAVALSAAYRFFEIVSNLSMLALFATQAPSIIQYVGGLLGAKAFCILVYWRFNLSHFGEVATSLFVFPGSETVCFDWVKDVRRLPTWVYVLIQLTFDCAVAGFLFGDARFALGAQDAFIIIAVLYTALASTMLKYMLGAATMFLHLQHPAVLYKDRRESLSCGLLKFSEDEEMDSGAEVQVRGRKVAVSKEVAAMMAVGTSDKRLHLQTNPMSKTRRASVAANPLALLQQRKLTASAGTGASPQLRPVTESSGGSGSTGSRAPTDVGPLQAGHAITSGSSEAQLRDSLGRRPSHVSSARFLAVSPGQRQPSLSRNSTGVLMTGVAAYDPRGQLGSSNTGSSGSPRHNTLTNTRSPPNSIAAGELNSTSNKPAKPSKRFRLSLAPRSVMRRTPRKPAGPKPDTEQLAGSQPSVDSLYTASAARPAISTPGGSSASALAASRSNRMTAAGLGRDIVVDLGDFE